MITYIKNKRSTLAYRVLSAFITLTFVFSIIVPPTPIAAQEVPLNVLNLPLPGTMVSLTPGFNPPLVKGITIHPENPLKFDFLVSPGDDNLKGNAFREESKKLIKYFLTSLTVPDNELWVNLSPYEKDRIISKEFGKTEMGRDMLAQDYILKQLTASLMYPEKELGKKFWNRVYTKAYEQYGTTEIPMNTFNKIWIVPEKAVVYEHGQTAFVVESHLKVMLEEDYLALENNSGAIKFGLDQVTESDAEIISGVSSQVVKEILIPEIEKEVNEGEIFTQLRQIYNSVILATWYKDNLRESLLGQIYVDHGKTKGVDVDDVQVNQKIYDQYIEAFQKGVYNYIKEDYVAMESQQDDTATPYASAEGDRPSYQIIPRKYFSGGFSIGSTRSLREDVKDITAKQIGRASSPLSRVEVDLFASNVKNKEAIEAAERTRDKGEALASSPITLPKGDWKKWVNTPVTMDDLNIDMFRDYDYRNTGPKLKPETVFRLGIVWANMAITKAQKAGINNRTVLIAKDARKIEPELTDALVAAMRYRGLNVIYMAKDTPNTVTSYSWGVQQTKPLMSIFITASHVSRPENIIVRGFKVAMLTKVGGNIQSLTTSEIKNDSLKAVTNIIEDPNKMNELESFRKGSFDAVNIDVNAIRFNTLVGKIAASNHSLYEFGNALKTAPNPLDTLHSFEKIHSSDDLPLKGMKIVIEGSHTPSGNLAASTFRNLGAEVTPLNTDIQEISGEHNADPSITANLKELEAAIIGHGADFGMAFDLDGDRGAVHVPQRSHKTSKVTFETLSPDNLIVALLPSLITNWGYDRPDINVGVIRDVLGTYGVNNRAEELGVETFQTDSGYVFLKAMKEAKEKENYRFPIYGERSGHTWLDVSGEIENPVAVGVLFAVLVRKSQENLFNKRSNGENVSQETINPALDSYVENSIPYSQSPRFQPPFHPELLKKLSNDPRNTTNWKFDFENQTKPPQLIIGLGKDFVIRALKDEFVVGKNYETPAGILTVSEFNDYQDAAERGGLYRFADIVFKLNGQFAGRFVFRASSNDPSFVASYEARQLSDQSADVTEAVKYSIAGTVLNFLVTQNLAVITKETMSKFNPHLTAEEIDKKFTKGNLASVESDLQQFQTIAALSVASSSPISSDTYLPNLVEIPESMKILGKDVHVTPLTKELLTKKKDRFTILKKLSGSDVLFDVDELISNPNKFDEKLSFAVADENGDPLGMVTMAESKRNGYVYLSHIAVNRIYQGTGLTSWILYKAFKNLKDQNKGYSNVHLTTTVEFDASNDGWQKVVDYYKRIGFRLDITPEHYLGVIPNIVNDEIVNLDYAYETTIDRGLHKLLFELQDKFDLIKDPTVLRHAREAFIKYTEHPYWVSTQTVEKIVAGLRESDSRSTYLDHNQVVQGWHRSKAYQFTDKSGIKHPLEYYSIRVENLPGRFGNRGGIRWTRPSNLMTTSFKTVLERFNTLKPTRDDEDQVKRLVVKWIGKNGETGALAHDMSDKNNAANINHVGGKGGIFWGQFIFKDGKDGHQYGTWHIEDYNVDNKTIEMINAHLAREHMQKMFDADIVGVGKGYPSADMNTGPVQMKYYADEYLRLKLALARQREGKQAGEGAKVFSNPKAFAYLNQRYGSHREQYETNPTIYPVLKAAADFVSTGETLDELGVVASKPAEYHETPGRTEATGRGIFDALEIALGKRLNHMFINDQGAGNVGINFAIRATERKGPIVRTLSNINIALFRDEGFTLDQLQRIKNALVKGQSFDELIADPKVFPSLQDEGIQFFAGDRNKTKPIVEQLADFTFHARTEKFIFPGSKNSSSILAPNAIEDVITMENVAGIDPQFVSHIAPGANGAASIDSIIYLFYRGIVYMPDGWVNAKGVIHSTIGSQRVGTHPLLPETVLNEFDIEPGQFISEELADKVGRRVLELEYDAIKAKQHNFSLKQKPIPMEIAYRLAAKTNYEATLDATASSPIDTSLPQGIEIQAPLSFAQFLNEVGLSLDRVEIQRLKGNLAPETVLSDTKTRFVVETSIGQAFGSILFAGEGKKGKEVADGNAVEFARRSLKSFIKDNPDEAIAILADEGERDDSFSLKRGRIYWSGFRGGYYDPNPEHFMIDLRRTVKKLRDKGVNVNYWAGDALEKTNGLAVKEARTETTDSSSLTALMDDVPDVRKTVHDKFRIGGITFNAPNDGGVEPLDLPSIAIPKIAKARSINEETPEFANMVNHITILVLGKRGKDLAKENTQSGDSRHAEIINDAKAMKKQYPGLKIVTPGDGDFGPRAVAALGLDLDGREMIVFGRSGAAEATIARLVAKIAHNGQFTSRFLSEKQTAKEVSTATMDSYDEFDMKQFGLLGYIVDGEETFRNTQRKNDFEGGGTFAMTSVTGASEGQFGKTLSNLMQRVGFDAGAGIAATSTLVTTKDGSTFIIRAKFKSNNMEEAMKAIKTASPEAAEYVEISSSPIAVERAEDLIVWKANQILPQINNKITNLIGLTQEEARKQFRSNKFTEIGFDPANRLGWSLPRLKEILDNPEMLDSTFEAADNLRTYKYVIFSGMGGSGLSMQVVKSTFDTNTGPRMYSLRTTDAGVIKEIIDNIVNAEGGDIGAALTKTAFVSTTKSFTTAETLSHQKYMEGLYIKYKVRPRKGQFTIYTDPPNGAVKIKKYTAAQRKGYEIRYIQLNGKTDIGGRFTAPTTNVFLLPLAIRRPRTEVIKILQRALEMNDVRDPNLDTFGRLGVYLEYMDRYLGKDKLTVYVPDELRDLPAWSEQLFEESLGKEEKGVSVIYGEQLTLNEIKTVDHSDRIFLRINIGGMKTDESFFDRVKARGHPVFNIDINSVDDIGGIMLGLQRAVAVYAYLQNINFTTQPGVDGYKKATSRVLDALGEGEKVQVPEMAHSDFRSLKIYYAPFIEAGIATMSEIKEEVTKIGATMNNGAAVYAALINIALRKAQLDPQKYGTFELAEIAAYGRMNKAFRAVMENARAAIFTNGLKIASKLGEGPNKNHSYQQMVAQGKNYHFSTYFKALKTEQPQYAEYDTNTNDAIPLGTTNSLVNVGRKVVLITMDGTLSDSIDDVRQFFVQVDKYINYKASSSPVKEDLVKNLAAFVAFTHFALHQAIREGSNRGSNLEELAFNKTLTDEIYEWIDSASEGILRRATLDQLRVTLETEENSLYLIFRVNGIVEDLERVRVNNPELMSNADLRAKFNSALSAALQKYSHISLSNVDSVKLAIKMLDKEEGLTNSGGSVRSGVEHGILALAKESFKLQAQEDDRSSKNAKNSDQLVTDLALAVAALPSENRKIARKHILYALRQLDKSKSGAENFADDLIYLGSSGINRLNPKIRLIAITLGHSLAYDKKTNPYAVRSAIAAFKKIIDYTASSPIEPSKHTFRVLTTHELSAIERREYSYPVLKVMLAELNASLILAKTSLGKLEIESLGLEERPDTWKEHARIVTQITDDIDTVKRALLTASSPIKPFENYRILTSKELSAISKKELNRSDLLAILKELKSSEGLAEKLFATLLDESSASQAGKDLFAEHAKIVTKIKNDIVLVERAIANTASSPVGFNKQEMKAVSRKVPEKESDAKTAKKIAQLSGVPQSRTLSILTRLTTEGRVTNDGEGKFFKLDSASSPAEREVGGINLNPALLDLEIKRNSNGIPLPMNLQSPTIMDIEGLLPVIINVTPIINLPMLLGFDMPESDEKPTESADSNATHPSDLSFYRMKYIRKYQNDSIGA